MKEKNEIKKISFFITFLIILLIIACLPTKPEKEATQNSIPIFLDKEFMLKLGQTAFFDLQEISITFNKVISDSRCPSDVVCFWQGEVQIELLIKIKEFEPINVIMTENQAKNHYEFVGFTLILLKVEPYPISNKRISSSDYTATLIIKEIKSN